MGIRKKKTLLEKAQGVVSDEVLPQVEAAIAQARPHVEAGLGKVVQAAHDGKQQAGPLVKAGTVAAAGTLSQVAAKAADAATLASQLAEEKAAALKQEEPKSKGGKLKKFLLVTVLVGVGGVVFKKLKESREADKWQNAYTPPPAPKSPTANAAAAPGGTPKTPPPPASPSVTTVEDPSAGKLGDDAAGADPAEALADAVDEPHAPSTPDNPADVVDVAGKTPGEAGDKPKP